MDDQLSVLNASGITAAILRANVIQRESLPFDESIYPNTSFVELQVDVEIKSLERGEYSLVFSHPEAIISSSAGIQLIQSACYSMNVQAVVVDEAHCILEW